MVYICYTSLFGYRSANTTSVAGETLGGFEMKALLFTGVLSLAFALLAFIGARRADKRGLILIALAVLVALDIWVVQTPRMQVAVTTGGKMADLAIITAFGVKFGALDVALAVAIIATFAAISTAVMTGLSVLAQVVAFVVGLAVAKSVATPLPGAAFIAAFTLPFIWFTRKEWAKMPAGDKISTAVVCGLALVVSLAGLVKAVA